MRKDIKEIILIFCSVIIISMIMIWSLSANITKHYQNKTKLKNEYIINNLLEKHPEWKEDVIDSFLLNNPNGEGRAIVLRHHLYPTNQHYYPIYLDIIIITSVLLFFVIGFLCIFYYRRNKKIRQIDHFMNEILNGNYSLDIKDYEEGPISNLKNNIYKMTVLLKEQRDLLKQEKKYLEETLEDISHQIKTPLTSMYMIQDILEDTSDEKTKKEFLSKNKNQIERIEWLITSLLKISRLDSGTIKLKEEKVKVSELITKAIEPISISLELKNIDIEYHLTNNTVIIDKNWTVEALLNIIKNACEHTKDKIKISSITNPLYTQIMIEDNGAGIHKNDLPHIFERFYKGNHNKDSIGIGLNMSKKIINLQNGEIEVKTKENEGTCFSIKLYKKEI